MQQVASQGEKGNSFGVLVGKQRKQTTWKTYALDGIIILKWILN